MGATVAIVALWVLFAVTHMGFSSLRLRPRLVAALGPGPFAGLYSLLALAIFIPLVWVYLENRHAGPLLWALSIGPVLRWLLYVVMGAGFVLIVGGLVEPSPAMIGGSAPEVRGIHRITRHPLFMGLALFGLVHLAFMGFASDVAFYAGFPLFALIGCAHQDRRKLATEGDAYRAWHEATAFLPFTGRDTARGLRELRPVALLLGVVLTIGLHLLHGPLFWS
jgi:uncharacterized membrane protein